MPSKEKWLAQLLQGTLDRIVLRTLETMGRQHAYQITSRLHQVSDQSLEMNQGTLYPALMRLEPYGWLKGTWGKTEPNREAKSDATPAGRRALEKEKTRWRTMSELVERLLLAEAQA